MELKRSKAYLKSLHPLANFGIMLSYQNFNSLLKHFSDLKYIYIYIYIYIY